MAIIYEKWLGVYLQAIYLFIRFSVKHRADTAIPKTSGYPLFHKIFLYEMTLKMHTSFQL
ncbi:hypothetical protein LIT32_18720 [Bacillus sp. CMF21]|uniref:hypothetical protein n=1 Tax=Metabacillus dongyingensis TaxID=2874282 RepID=UPI001CC160E2|nr:hypothetical protein [Metabacillus dongyingensis]UAL51203.1 hypothetical protein K8L98_18575 [Metabacillus dongyingensis]USK27498.1 hypothetical protein LIT32_18720 [Bacillus sp. CMF21]